MGKLDFYDREDRPWPNERLRTAAIVGHTTPTSTRLWVRVSAPGPAWLVVSRTPLAGLDAPAPRADGPRRLRTGAAPDAAVDVVHLSAHDFRFDTDLTHVFDVDGLAPDTTYHYAVFRERNDAGWRWELGHVDAHGFRTFPVSTQELRFGVLSCHMPYKKGGLLPLTLWEELRRRLEERGGRYVLGVGDQVYVDGAPEIDIWRWLARNADAGATHEDMVSWYRDIYRGYWGPLPVRRLFRSFPTYMVWDDHEVKDGWGSYTEEELGEELDRAWHFRNDPIVNLGLAKAMFTAARQVYGEYEHGHNPPTAPGVWDYAFRCGPVATYVLELRGHRGYWSEAGPNLLGHPQLDRLRSWLAGEAARVGAGEAGPPRVVFVVSPVPLVHAKPVIVGNGLVEVINIDGLRDDLRDQWEHPSNRAERAALLETLWEFRRRTGVPVVVLSGDVHTATAFRLDSPAYPDLPLLQLTTSAITYANTNRLLEWVAADAGPVAGADAVGKVTGADRHGASYRRLVRAVTENNFGLVRVVTDGAHTTVEFDVYALDATGEGATRVAFVHFDGRSTRAGG